MEKSTLIRMCSFLSNIPSLLVLGFSFAFRVAL